MPIEAIAVAAEKVAEVSAKAAEVGAKTAEASKKAVDISKRVDVTKAVADGPAKGIDISKRIVPEGTVGNATKEVASSDLKEVAKEYISDLKAKSSVADTIKDNCIDVNKLEKVSPDKVAEMREQFDDNKAKLRKEWEAINNKEWPRYKQDVYNDNGVRIRKAGDCYDAHHIQPLSMGGANEASNLTPLDLSKHSEIHSSGGSCTKLVEKFEGVGK